MTPYSVHTVAGEPTHLTCIVSYSNTTHADITVSWVKPLAGNTTGYVVYYQSNGEQMSDKVVGEDTEAHLIEGVRSGLTYYISIVALSQHLPSPLVGPVSVAGKSFNYHTSYINNSLYYSSTVGG